MKIIQCIALWCFLAALFPPSVFADEELNAMLDFYREHSDWTDPGLYARLYEGVADDIESVVRSVQNVLLHGGLVRFYGLTPSAAQSGGQNIRRTEELLKRISLLDPNPLSSPRPLRARLLVNCRQFSVLTCSILRQKGVPARARAGYGLYLGGSIRYENHWICEYWSEAERRWIQVDAQIDGRQKQLMGISFNPRNLPTGRFVTAGEGWRRFRDGRVPLASFGVFGNSLGWSMVMPNVICDTMALNKDELLPWDTPPYWEKKQEDMSSQDMALIRKLAEWDWNSAAGFSKRRALYRNDPHLRMPADFEKKER